MKGFKLLLFMLMLGISLGLQAQMKIGYTNLELLITYLPETQQINKDLQTYQQQLAKKLETKKNYFDVKVQEYTEKAQQPNASATNLAPLEQELQKLQEELQRSLEDSERDLGQRQSELMAPVMENLQKEFTALAEEKGYTYILNLASSGSSIILHAPESDNVTEELLKRLGVEIPED